MAVVALVLAIPVVGIVVAGSLNDSGSGGEPAGHAPHVGRSHQPAQKYYVIQQDDTFDGIAAKFGVSPARLQTLNPDLDIQQLPVTGCVNLVPEGCRILTHGG